MKKIISLFFLVICFSISNSSFATGGDTLSVNPNPFDSVTVIHFEINANDTVTLDVFNNVGYTIKTYFNLTVLPAGSYSFNFDGDTLPNGVYFVHLKINSITYTVKIVKIKNAVGLKEDTTLNLMPLLFPNPTTSILQIPFNGLKTIIVTSLNGSVLLHTTTEVDSISLSQLSTGSYIVTILSEKNQILTTEHIFKLD